MTDVVEHAEPFEGIDYLGGGVIELDSTYVFSVPYWGEHDGKVCISYFDADKIFLSQKIDTQPWWDDAVSQAKQIRDNPSRCLIARLPEGDYVAAGNYVHSFTQWLEHNVQHQGCVFDRRVGGTIVSAPVFPSATNTVMSECGIQATTVASAYISPQTDASVKLAEAAELAYDAGFALPSPRLFPTQRTLMKHQQDPVVVMAHRGRALLGDDVGSGKGSMFFCGFLSLVQHRITEHGHTMNQCFPLVIVTKKSLAQPIERECQAWFQGCVTHIVQGSKKQNYPDGVQVIICPINSLDKHVDDILELDPQGVIFDESHMVKNPDAKRTQAALALSEHIQKSCEFPYTVCASATPMPNRPSELWAQLVITGMNDDIIEHCEANQSFPHRTKTSFKNNWTIPVNDRMKFEMRYCQGKPGPFGWDARGVDNEKELNDQLIQGGLIRRKKNEFITPLPLLHQRFLRCELDEKTRKEYDVAQKDFSDFIVASSRMRARMESWDDQTLRRLISEKLSKAQRSEAIMKMTAVRQLAGKGKVECIANWVERFFNKDPAIVGLDTDRNKLIIFAHHKDVQKALINHPSINKHGVEAIVAGTKNVNDIVDRFQSQTSGTNIVVCYSEAREGLTLTAAKDVLVAELPFMPSWLIQMGGRCWARVSEDYPPHEAYLHYAVADVDIDKYLENMIRQKAWLHRAIIDGEVAHNVLNQEESGEVEDTSEDAFNSIAATMLKNTTRP